MRKAATFPVLLILSACGPPELSRSKAADLLKGHVVFAEDVTALPLQESGRLQGKYDAGVVEGIWSMSRRTAEYTRYSLTPKGREVFARDFSANEPAPLKQSAKRELLEVSGITTPPTAGESIRLASFSWHYGGLSPTAARYSGEEAVTHSGEALFQLFDDGWRVQEINLHEYEGRRPFEWPPELQQKLQQQLEAKRLTQEKAVDLARTALGDHEPVLNLSLGPALNVPSRHGITGQTLNEHKFETFLALLSQHKVGVSDAKSSGGYYQIAALAPPGAWSSYERRARYTGVRTYAIFTTSEMQVKRFNYSGPGSDKASLEVEVVYSGCTPICELAKALEAFQNFDYGGRAVEKVFYGYPREGWRDRDSGVIYFQQDQDDSWKVSGVR